MDFPTTPDGKLLAFISFGCYPLIYLDKTSNVLCAECATESLNDPDESFRPVRYDVHWEGSTELVEVL